MSQSDYDARIRMLTEQHNQKYATNGAADEHASRVDWNTLWAGDEKDDEEWLVEPVLPLGRTVALYSAAKQGKSLLALDIAVRLATGRRVFHRPAGTPLNVVYIDLEMSRRDVRDRLEAMDFGPDDDLSHLDYELAADTLPPLDTAEGGATVLALARRHLADLIIIDATQRALIGAENDADTLRAYYRFTGSRLKRDGYTVLRLDNTGKDPTRGQRGTSAKADDVDVVWQLSRLEHGIRLTATHRRQSWVPQVYDLTRLDEPLRHEAAAERDWPAGTLEMADLLDRLEIPLDAGRRRIRKALADTDYRARNEIIEAAIKYRRQRQNVSPNTRGHVDQLALGDTFADTGQPGFGDTPGDTWDTTPQHSGDTPPPYNNRGGVPMLDSVSQKEPPEALPDDWCAVPDCNLEADAYWRDGTPLCERHYRQAEHRERESEAT